MSFNIGLLEMIGYFVPGATVLATWLWVTGALPLDPAGKLEGTAGLALILLASYVLGQLLTIASSVIKVSPPQNPYQSLEPFRTHFQRRFGKDLPAGASYHLARALVIHHSPGLGERVERYFALLILSRNLVMASIVVTALLVRSSELAWGAAWAVAAVAFFIQHGRFCETEGKAVFGAAFTILAAAIASDEARQNSARADEHG